jgi:CRISPR/Cas system-associated protein Csx1
MILKKISCKAILNKKNTCTNKLGEKISCPSIWWGKNVAKQHGCRDRFDQSQKISWLDFQGLV